ncbi:YfhO family protein [Breznakia sp. OttesenSCG-928-G09]|nr:YfhO family protein [Breznakia sp. OttesenSCG-928-G09]
MKDKKNIYPYLFISGIAILMIILYVPNGYMFGSNTDWLSQHVQIADTLRTTMYEQGLFPNFVDALGGGQNVYAFSYYGLFRPDVLISLLLPMVAMKDVIIVYMMISFIVSLNLLYYWLKQKDIDTVIAFLCTMLFAFSSFFFHLHRQIMFVNYMPYLILSFIFIDRIFNGKSKLPFIISIVLIILHSFFFSVSCSFVLMIYIFYNMKLRHIKLLSKQGKKIILNFVFIFLVAFMICGILLLPTAYVLLAGARGGSNGFDMQLLLPNIQLKNFLYYKYGMGLSLISWIALSFGLRDKKIRGLSISLLICMLFGLICYVLNGTLYIREKVFIPFIPLVLYVTAYVLQHIKWDAKAWMYPALGIALLPLLNFRFLVVWIVELVFISITIILYMKTKKSMVYLLILLVPFVNSYWNNHSENYVSKQKYDEVMMIKADEKLKDLHLDQNYRFDDVRYQLNNVNLALPGMKRTTMYTSMNNQAYNTFFYDIAKNAIPTKNRVITSLQQNIVFQEKMGVRYLYTNKKYIPKGYEVVYENDGVKLLENKNVLPIAYATDALYSEEAFDKLSLPYTLDVLYNRTIVKGGDSKYEFGVKQANLTTNVLEKSDCLEYFREDGTIYIDSKKKSKLKLGINHDLHEQILIITFDVKNISNIKSKDLSISINGVNNKLSSKKAAYPNGNTNFIYVLSSEEELDSLNITLGKGTYELQNIQTYTLPYHPEKQVITPLQTTSTNHVLEGDIRVDKDCYFVTSLPIQKGYEVYVDGQKKPVETVNKAFVGFALEKGTHEIKITFVPPGKTLGAFISIIGLCGFIIIYILERRYQHE